MKANLEISALKSYNLGGRYLAFGLLIDSPIPLPEASPAGRDTPADVTVTLGEPGGGLPDDSSFIKAREKRTWWFGMPGATCMIFNCPSGLYVIKNGNEIFISLYPDADMELAKIYLLGSAMGAIQVQRGRIPVHGGVVSTPRGAMIITGGQGVGKSTMTSAFVHNGYSYLSDDVSSVSIENGHARVFPAYPQRKLIRDACAPLGYVPDDLILVDEKRDKFAVRDRDNWQSEPADLWAIIELYPVEGGRVTVSPVTGHKKLAGVTRNLYRMWMHLPGGEMKPEVFKKVLTIASQAEEYRVEVPRDIENIAGIAGDISAALGI